jgi:hypothetical protein
MHTLIVICCCLGFFMLYNTSKRAKLSNTGKIEKWLQQHPLKARQLGCSLIVISLILLIGKEGVSVGLFTALLLLMASASYIVAIAPFYYFRFRHVGVLALMSFLIELFIF